MTLTIPSFLENMGPEKLLQMIGIIIPLWAIFMILLERIRPYTTHVKLFRRGFWMDLVWYTIVQSKFMEILIFGSIILPLKIGSFATSSAASFNSSKETCLSVLM
jgi:hypothetical protein